jgi:phospholipid/cholesterol/gamma-HCH transport system ATP-binding protein
MRRFRFGGTRSKGDQQVPETPQESQQGAGSAMPFAGADPSGGWQGAPEPSGEQPTQQQGTPSDQPAPIGSGSQQWIPRGPSGGEQPGQQQASDERESQPDAGQMQPSALAQTETGGATPGSQQQESGGQPEGGEEREESHAEGEDQGRDQEERQGQGEDDAEAESEEERSESRVSVVDEPQSRPAPPPGASEEDYKWHTYTQYPSGRPDAIEFIDMYKAFGRNHILRGLNMGLPEGMVSMILGPSGTGKSVCIKHMVGLLYPDDGDVLVHGESVPNMPDDDLFDMRKKFGLLFQDGALFGSMNVFDNTAFPLRQHTEKSEDEISDIVTRRLNEVGLGSAGDNLPNELSGGMRKRAGFARALVLEPDIVLFDEPDSGLDPVRTALLGELILEIHRDMMDDAKKQQKEHLPTFSVITHDIMSARRVADYINVLWKGRIVEAGPAEDMLNSDNPFIRQFLSGESQGPLTMD